MSAEENKAALRRAVQHYNAHNWDAYYDSYEPACVLHGFQPEDVAGIEQIKQAYSPFVTAFPDGQATLDDVVAEGDRVAGRVTFRGTHKGEFLGAPASGKRVAVEFIRIYRFVGGKIAEGWSRVDTMDFMQQLGAIPSPV